MTTVSPIPERTPFACFGHDSRRRSARPPSRQRQLERYAADLREVFKQERARAQELRRSYRATVRALSNAVEARDAYTGKHAERVTAYGMALARAAGARLEESPQIEFGFLLHDIGKVAVPDAILFKTSSLTEEEYALVRRHPVIGVGDPARRGLPRRGQARRAPPPRALGRHRLPGRPRRRQIPLAARVFSVADTLDALTTDRPYRPASTFADARQVIRRVTGQPVRPLCRRRVRRDRRRRVRAPPHALR